ncbi:hypothetical protein GTQ99_03595 [Kineococcus sp. T13]|uniref:DUF7489 domain-containing protein n=1 Tax=Kineococcus vitellinus TaxID=2696565 RepID=UPI001411E358|nr:hypothetical protein [Kineococcus vitellinus]NAZ74508.1 hypothetical protein [Kineococcus vitellinus]
MIHHRASAAALLAAAALALSACGEPVVGTVTAKEHEAAETERTTTRKCTGSGAEEKCRSVPTTRHDPEEWELTVETDDGSTVEFTVAEDVYDSVRVGDRYDETQRG